MEITRNSNVCDGKSIKVTEDISKYLRLIIDIFSSLDIDRSMWLTEREKEFYISTVICIISGYKDPICDESVQIYKKYFNPKTNKGKISDYINRIRKKNWLKYNKITKVVEVPELFSKIDISGDNTTFNLEFKYGSPDRSDTIGNTE